MKKKENILYKSLILILVLNINCSSKITKEKKLENKQAYLNLFQEAYNKINKHFYKIKKLNEKELFFSALKGMFQALKDPHSIFLNESDLSLLKSTNSGKFAGIGVNLRIKNKKYYIIKTIKNSPAELSGLKPKDQIIKINNLNLKKLSIKQIIKKLRGKENSKVQITILRKDKEKKIQKSFKLKRIKLNSTQVISEIINKKIGYIKLSHFSKNSDKKIYKNLKVLKQKKIQALIFDLRGNPGGSPKACINILSYFFQKKTKVLHTYNKSKKIKKTHYSNPKQVIFPKIPLILLSNKESASASEIFLAAIKENKRGIIIGEQSYGKGSVQLYMPSKINPKVGFKITNAIWLSPKENNINKKGITPTIKVKRIKLNSNQKYIISEIEKKDLVKNFIDSNPNLTNKDQQNFIKLISKTGYKIKAKILIDLLLKEKLIQETKIKAKLNYDNDLKLALKYINQKLIN